MRNNIVKMNVKEWELFCYKLEKQGVFVDNLVAYRRENFCKFFNCNAKFRVDVESKNLDTYVYIEFNSPADATMFTLKWL